MDQTDDRTRFEEKAFQKRFLMSITRSQDKGPRMASELVSVDCPPKQEFLERGEDGQYIDQTLNAMWWAWQEGQKRW